MNTQIGVYKITFPDGHFYIGSAYGKMGFERRWNQHKKGYKNSPKYLRELAIRCGWENVQFIVLKIAKNKHRSLLWEQAYVNKFSEDSMLMNKNKNIFEAPDMSGENNPFYGRNHSPESKEKIRIAKLGTVPWNKDKKGIFGPESCQKMSQAKIGKNPWHKRETKTHSLAAKEKMTKNHADNSGEKNGRSKLTWQLVEEIRKKFATKNFVLSEMAKEYGVVLSTIFKICTNKTWRTN